MKKSDLSYAIKKLLEPFKYWAPEQKKAFMPVIEYATKLEQRVKGLEERLRYFNEPKLGTVFPEGSHMSRSFQFDPRPTGPVMSRDERIHLAIKEGLAETEEFKRMLRWMDLTETQAFEIYGTIEASKLNLDDVT